MWQNSTGENCLSLSGPQSHTKSPAKSQFQENILYMLTNNSCSFKILQKTNTTVFFVVARRTPFQSSARTTSMPKWLHETFQPDKQKQSYSSSGSHKRQILFHHQKCLWPQETLAFITNSFIHESHCVTNLDWKSNTLTHRQCLISPHPRNTKTRKSAAEPGWGAVHTFCFRPPSKATVTHIKFQKHLFGGFAPTVKMITFALHQAYISGQFTTPLWLYMISILHVCQFPFICFKPEETARPSPEDNNTMKSNSIANKSKPQTASF